MILHNCYSIDKRGTCCLSMRYMKFGCKILFTLHLQTEQKATEKQNRLAEIMEKQASTVSSRKSTQADADREVKKLLLAQYGHESDEDYWYPFCFCFNMCAMYIMFLLINVCLNVTFIREKGGKGRPQIMLTGNMIQGFVKICQSKNFLLKMEYWFIVIQACIKRLCHYSAMKY